jgi:transmembrane sensor
VVDPNIIDAEARAWVARLDYEGRSPELEVALEHWLAVDRRHQGAFLRAQAAWVAVDRIRGVVDAPAVRKGQTRRLMLGGLAAGGLAAAASAGFVLLQPATVSYQTGAGELRRVSLSDGSFAVLNADTVLTVSMRTHERRIGIRNGDVWFQVAKDAERPFIVTTDRMKVRAVGTEFAVRSGGASTQVLVNEGVVEVASTAAPSTVRRLPAGLTAGVRSDGQVTVTAMSLDVMKRALAWRDGQIGLDGETLREAVQIFNRYNARKLIIVDPELADRRLVGWFRIDDPEGFAKIASAALNVRVEVQASQIVLENQVSSLGRGNFVAR